MVPNKTKSKDEDIAGDNWQTPKWVWGPWFERFHVELDAAANEVNTLVNVERKGSIYSRAGFISEKQDALSFEWTEREIMRGSTVWCNPPYSQKAGPLKLWIEKFEHESEIGLRVIALLPADTSTRWFTLLQALERDRRVLVYYLPKRVRHIHPLTSKQGGSPKFGSVIAHFDRRLTNPYT